MAPGRPLIPRWLAQIPLCGRWSACDAGLPCWPYWWPCSRGWFPRPRHRGRAGQVAAGFKHSLALLPSGARVSGRVTLQRSGAPLPGPPYATQLLVRVYAAGSAGGSAQRTPLAATTASTDAGGAFDVTVPGLRAGIYDPNVKPAHALSVEKQRQAVSSEPTVCAQATGVDCPPSFGIAPEGDANDDDAVTILDFSLLAASFNKQQGQAGFRPQTDFNQDGAITILDFSLLATNFNRVGPVLAP